MQHLAGVHVAVPQQRQRGHGLGGHGVIGGGHRQAGQGVVHLQHAGTAAQDVDLHPQDGLQHLGTDQGDVLDAGDGLDAVQHGGAAGAHQVAGPAGDDPAVRQTDGRGGLVGLVPALQGRGHHRPVGGLQAQLLQNILDLVQGRLAGLALLAVAGGLVVPAQDLLAGGGAHHLVVKDRVAGHVHTHVGGAAVELLVAGDPLQDGLHDGEGFHVPVVVDGGLAVGLQVERVDHVHVVQIGGGGLIGQVYRMLQGDVPDGEGLKLGVACHHAPAVLVVHLAQAGGQLAAARAGRGDHHQRLGGFNIGIGAVARVAADVLHRGRIAGNGPVDVVAHPAAGKLLGKGVGGGLAGVLGDDHAVHRKAGLGDVVDQAQHLHVVADAQIRPDLGLFDIPGRDGKDDLRLVLHGLQQPDLAVGVETGQHPGGVVVVKQLAAKLQIQLAGKLGNPLADFLGLLLYI